MKSCKLLAVSFFLVVICCDLKAQCTNNFKVDEIQYDEAQLGLIKVLIEEDKSNLSYRVKVYQINSEVTLVSEGNQIPVNNRLSIKGLKPSTYWIRLEWGDACFKTIGGLDGIVVRSNKEGQ